MVDHVEPVLDNNNGRSYLQRTVVIENWWIVKCLKEFEGKRFGVAGFEIGGSVNTRAIRGFQSSPIIKAFDLLDLLTSDGIFIILRGSLNKERVVESGFSPEIFDEFASGFPLNWEITCYKCFKGVPIGTDINIGSLITDTASRPILSPCKNTKGNLNGTDTNIPEINNKDGKTANAKRNHSGTTKVNSEGVGFFGQKKARLFWTTEEEEMLKVGVEKVAPEVNKNMLWTKVLKMGKNVFDETRSPSELKDKWRNMAKKMKAALDNSKGTRKRLFREEVEEEEIL